MKPVIEKWRAESQAQGWAWVEQVNGYSSRYRHSCGQEQRVNMSAMRRGLVKCGRCWLEKIKSEAKDHGWTWIERMGDDYSRYRHVACGQEQLVNMSAMRDKRVSCSHCWVEKIKAETTPHGWTWLAQIDRQRGLYRHVACGQEQCVGFGNMRKGRVACHACGESWATKPSHLYLLKIIPPDGKAFLKYGIAGDVNRRVLSYGLTPGCEVEVLATRYFATGGESVKVEKANHRRLKALRIGASAYLDNGATECYCIEAQADLMESFR